MNTSTLYTEARTARIACDQCVKGEAEPLTDADRRVWLFLNPGSSRVRCEACHTEEAR